MESDGKARSSAGAPDSRDGRNSPIRGGSAPLPLAGLVFQVRHASVTRIVAEAGKDSASYENIVAAAQSLQEVDVVAWEEELQALVSCIGIDLHPAPDPAEAHESASCCSSGCFPSRRSQPRIAPTYQPPSWTARIPTTWSLATSFEAGLEMWEWMIRVARGLARVIEERYSNEACTAAVQEALREVDTVRPRGWTQPRIDALAAAVAAACHPYDREVHRSSREPSLTYLRHAVLGLTILQGSATPFRRPSSSLPSPASSLSRPPENVPRPGPFCALTQVSRAPSVNRLLRLLLTSAWHGDDPLAYPPRGGLSFSHTFRAPNPAHESASSVHHASPTDIAVAMAGALGLPWDRSVVSQTPARGGRWLPLLPILDGATKLTLMYPHWRAALAKQRPWRLHVSRENAWTLAARKLREERRDTRSAPEISPMFVRGFSAGDGGAGSETEEGEGHGPRKEFFSLLGNGWMAQWGEPMDVSDASATLTCAHGDRRATVRGALPGWRAGWHGRVWIEPPSTAPQLPPTADTTRIELRVLDESEQDGAGGCWRVRLSSPAAFLPASGAQGLPCFIRQVAPRYAPPLVPRPGTSTVSYSEGMRESAGAVADMAAMGWFLGAALLHRCPCHVPLAPLQVGLLLLDLEEDVTWTPSLADLVQWDEGLEHSVRQVIALPETTVQEQAVAEGVPLSSTPRPASASPKAGRVHQAYLSHMIRTTLHDAVAWQADAVRTGFHTAVGAGPPIAAGAGAGPSTGAGWPNVLALFRDWGMGPVELTEVWAGESRGAMPALGRGTDVRLFFRVVYDEDMQAETVLQEAVWEAVAEWTASEQAAFLRFVTGVGKPPLPGSEILRLSSPFLAYSLADHQARLARLPEAHTCFNTLEIPNYRQSLQVVRQAEAIPEGDLENDCKRLVAAKLRCAVLEGGASYGLDAIGATGRPARGAVTSSSPAEPEPSPNSGARLASRSKDGAPNVPLSLPQPIPSSARKESASQRGPSQAQAVLSLELDGEDEDLARPLGANGRRG